AGALLWVSLREDRVVYVHGKAHALRSSATPFTPLPQGAGKSLDDEGRQLKEELEVEAARERGRTERQLKEELEAEAARERGRTVLHSSRGAPVWASVAEGGVRTPAEVVADEAEAVQRGGGAGFAKGCEYASLPSKDGEALSPAALESLLTPLTERPDSGGEALVPAAFAGGEALSPAALESLLTLLAERSEADAVVFSHTGNSPVLALAAAVACMAQRLRQAGGELPNDVLPHEPLPMTRKFAPARGLLE
ncbi:hypothetical protein T484DRAFT_1766122, partial [Baffinella frigidus]